MDEQHPSGNGNVVTDEEPAGAPRAHRPPRADEARPASDEVREATRDEGFWPDTWNRLEALSNHIIEQVKAAPDGPPRWRRLAVVGTGLLALVTATALVTAWRTGAFDDGPPGRPSPVPGEYLYLDNERVDAYLGQLDGGLAATEERSATDTRAASADVKALNAFSVSGSLQRQRFVKQVVTPRATDRFYALLTRLRQRPDWLSRVDVRRPIDLGDVHEGKFVEILNGRLFVPPYAALFPKAAYAHQLETPGLRRVPSSVLLPLRGELLGEQKRYVGLGGVDPPLPFRIPMTVRGASGTERERPMVFAPLRSSKLGIQPGLMSGRVNVLAKVVQVYPRTRPGATAAERRANRYFDIVTYTTFGRILRRAPERILRGRLGLRPSQVRRVVQRSATMPGPVVVLAPVAVYQ